MAIIDGRLEPSMWILYGVAYFASFYKIIITNLVTVRNAEVLSCKLIAVVSVLEEIMRRNG
jgi:hypothetical protein